LLRFVCSDYQAKSGLDSYESAGLDNEVTEGGYEEQLAAARMADEELEARDDAAGGRRGRKRMPGALEGADCAVLHAAAVMYVLVLRAKMLLASVCVAQPQAGNK
jgi:hypothetical protein